MDPGSELPLDRGLFQSDRIPERCKRGVENTGPVWWVDRSRFLRSGPLQVDGHARPTPLRHHPRQGEDPQVRQRVAVGSLPCIFDA